MNEPPADDAGEIRLTPGELTALRNLASKKAGEAVDWISIADARSLTEHGLAERNREGWVITPAGESHLAGQAEEPTPTAAPTPFIRPV